MNTNWINNVFVSMVDASKRIRPALWRWVYNHIAARDTSGKFLFMNYGFDSAVSTPLILKEADEPYRYYIQLYEHVVADISLQGKCVAEVGCGRGGGGSYLIRYHNPASYTGVDLSEKAIAWCQRQHALDIATWLQGRADALPLQDNSVDVVVNVESSHCYPSMENFLNEVKRVLRSQGYFSFCDMRRLAEIPLLENVMKNSGLRIVKQQEITKEVLQALDHVSAERDASIAAVFPKMFRGVFRDFAAVKDTAIYAMLQKGEMKYFSYLLQKE